MAILGIDLGTSNSAAAVAVAGVTQMIQPVEGATDEGWLFPSYVAFDINGQPSCAGLLAKRQYHGAANLIVRHAKRLIGRSYDYISRVLEQHPDGLSCRHSLDEFRGRLSRGDTGEVLIRVGTARQKQYAPHEIARILLEKIREDADAQVHMLHGERITQAIITVPAGFDDAPLRATLWAGEEVFGKGHVRLIPEPLAAAIASGTRKEQEMVMVVDMGAGTTDIVVGNVISVGGQYEWLPVTQRCDDELGGWDMDYQILEQMLLDDRKPPLLRDLYARLDLRNQGRLMDAIERAKIAVSTSGRAQISTVLEDEIDGTPVRKPVIFSLDDALLRKLVAYPQPRVPADRGSVVGRCRALVERTLLELADGNPARLPEAKAHLDRVILVGGPMRMRCLYDMMAEVFAAQPQVLERFDPLNTFPMECVARGAALYRGERVTLQVPHTLSLFNWSKGGVYQQVLLRNTPFEKSADAVVELDVEAGATWLDIVTEKENVALPDYPVREHLVRVPHDGKLSVKLVWDTAGCRLALSGAGITQVEIPAISEQTTLRENLTRQFVSALRNITQLRTLLADPRLGAKLYDLLWKNARLHAPEDVAMAVSLDPEAAQDAWRIGGKPIRQILQAEVAKVMAVPAEELARADALDLRTAAVLQPAEMQLMLEQGFIDGAAACLRTRGISERIYSTARTVRSVLQERVSVTELVNAARILLQVCAKARLETKLAAELEKLLTELTRHPHNAVVLANVSVRAAALADVLHDKGFISRDALARTKSVAAQTEVSI